MGIVNLVSVIAVACFLSACQSVTLIEAAVEQRADRLGTLNRYYLATWENIVSGTEMEQIPNNAAGIGALTLTGTENVAIVVHGRNSGAYSEFGHTLRTSLNLADWKMVVIFVDWSFISSLNYNQTVLLVPFVAEDLIAFIAQMKRSGKLDRNLLHLIGFDLGAHIVGIASRNPTARAKKITALSPAGDRWDAFSQRLRVTDAQCVETIHTDAVGTSAYGVKEAIGGLDFFPNGATIQPGCAEGDNWCYHNRAWKLFAATVDTGGHLIGLRCDSMTQVYNNTCVGLPTAFMGTLELIKLQTGLYRVNTRRTYPYNA